MDKYEPSLLLVPQTMTSHGGLFGWDTPDVTNALIKLIEEHARLPTVDPSRIHLSGYSMGGNGVFHLLHQMPPESVSFAAVSTISAAYGDFWAIPYPSPTAQMRYSILMVNSEADECVPFASATATLWWYRMQLGGPQYNISLVPIPFALGVSHKLVPLWISEHDEYVKTYLSWHYSRRSLYALQRDADRHRLNEHEAMRHASSHALLPTDGLK